MKSDFFVKLKNQSSTIMLSVGNKYYVRDLLYDIISNAWPARSVLLSVRDGRKIVICVTYGKWCQRSLWHQLDLASCELHSWNHLLDGDLCKHFFVWQISLFSCFQSQFDQIVEPHLFYAVSQLQAQQLMTSQIRFHIEYLIQTDNILLLIFLIKIYEKSSLIAGF